MKAIVAFLCMSLVLVAATAVRADDTVPEEGEVCKQAMDLLSAGKQAGAEQLIFARLKQHASKRIVFFAAALVRSRFDVTNAGQIFSHVKEFDPNCVEGRASALIMAIDQGQKTEVNFKELDDLAGKNPEDPLLLWMVAVECRQLAKPQIGIERYGALLKKLDPGPALIHQTYGNLLMQDHQPDKALEQYDIAIKMEPASWDYSCRGNALTELGRLDEATEAYKKATELNPDDVLPWYNWARLCDAQHDAAGAAEKRAKVAEIREQQK